MKAKVKPHVWKYFTTQKQWKSYLCDLLDYSDDAVRSAILCIDGLQTEEEKQLKDSVVENAIGWSKIDAEYMDGIVAKIKNNEQLTSGELAKSRNKIKKYWKQLMVLSKIKLANTGNQNHG